MGHCACSWSAWAAPSGATAEAAAFEHAWTLVDQAAAAIVQRLAS